METEVAADETTMDTEVTITHEIPLTKRVHNKWLESTEGTESIDMINLLAETESVISNNRALDLPSTQARLGAKGCLGLGWMFEHWHCLHLYSQVIPRVKIESGELKLSGTEGILSCPGTVAGSIQNSLKMSHQMTTGLQKFPNGFCDIEIYHATFPRWIVQSSAQTLYEEVWNFLDVLKTKKSVAMPAVGTGKLEYPPAAAAEIIISTALEFFLDHPECKTTLSICILPENAKILEDFIRVLHKIQIGARQNPQERRFRTISFTGSKEAVEKANQHFWKELKSVIIHTDWTDSPLSDGISLLTTNQIVELEMLATQHNTDIYISKPEKVIRLLGVRADVEKLRGFIDYGLFSCIAKSLHNHVATPDHWEEGVNEVVLDSSSEEYATVTATWVLPANYEVIKITRIQNAVLHAQYNAQNQKVIESLGDLAENAERKLWHGTTMEKAKKICSQEFNRSFAGMAHGAHFGQGTYFAVYPGKAMQYGHQCLILAKVLTGRYYQGSRETTRASLATDYHSTVDNVTSPTFFVIYHDASAYPEYVLEYRLK